MKNFFKKINKENGKISFEMQVLLFILALFIIWVLTNGNKTTEENQRLFTPYYEN